MLLRRLLVVIAVLLAGSAWAVTPGQRALLFSGIKPVFQVDLTQGALPSQISFSRASNAMLFDSTGKLTFAPNNLYTSNSTTLAAATTENSTLTPQTGSGPNGENFPTLTEAANTGRHDIFVANSASGAIGSFYVKRGTGTRNVAMGQGNGQAGATFNLDNSTVTTTGTQITGAGMTSLGNGWFRVWIAISPAAGTGNFFIGLTDLTNTATSLPHSYTGDGTSSIFVGGYQDEAVTYQTTPSTYNPTTSAAYFGPRFDYNPSTLAPLGLLIEEQRTNVVLQNRDLTNASWTKTNITAAKDQTGIDGVASSASSILATAGNGTALQAITLASSQRFQTAYVQRITGTGVVNMTTDGGATWTAITIPGAGTWGRVSIPAQTVTNPSVGFQLVTNTDKIAVDFVQNETGAFATSPIATTTTSVIRSADLPSSTNPTLLTARAWIVETGEMQAATAATVLGINTGIGLGETAGNALTTAYGGAQTTGNTATWTGTNRSGIAFDASPRVSLVLNGGTVVTAANSTSVPANLYFGNTNNGASAFMNGHLRKLCAYQLANDNFIKTKSVVGIAC